jgi:hypothetical protein
MIEGSGSWRPKNIPVQILRNIEQHNSRLFFIHEAVLNSICLNLRMKARNFILSTGDQHYIP